MENLFSKKIIIFGSTAFLMIGFNLNKAHAPDPSLKWRARPLIVNVNQAGSALPTDEEPLYNEQFHLNYLNLGTTHDTNRGANVTVAIIDSGININHLDFYDGSFTNISLKSAAIKELGNYTSNLKITPVTANDFSVINDPVDNGHGTNVAGTIGALVNGIGTLGVSPEVTLMVLKTDYYFTEIDRAIRYAADNGADVINMSIGAYENTFTDSFGQNHISVPNASTFFQNSINYAYQKGVTIIAAAGNENSYYKSYPASNNNVIGVGALSRASNTKIAYYSNHGSDNVDLVAPGSVYVADIGSSTSYTETQGTSFSAPIVASAAALFKSKYPSATPALIEQKLKATAYDLGNVGPDAIFGHGRLDISKLLSDVPVTGVELTPATNHLLVGETVQLVANILPSDATNKDVLFISNDDVIATVDEITGLVTANNVGEVEIGVLTDDGSFDAYATVVVSNELIPIPVAGINFANSSMELVVNASQTLDVMFTPTNASNKSLTFSSSDQETVSVTNAGLVNALAPGSATITATSVDGGHSANVNIVVKTTISKSITYAFTDKNWNATPSSWISGKDGLEYSNNGVQVTSGVSGANARSPVFYNNIDSIRVGYATNASKGAGTIELLLLEHEDSLTGTSLGEFSVTTTGGTTKRDSSVFVPTAIKSGFIKIIVTTTTNSIYICDIDIDYQEIEPVYVAVTDVEVTTGPLSLFISKTATLSYTVLPANATNKSVTFDSLDSNIATVSSEGVVTGISVGTTSIKVSTNEGGFTDFVAVTVSAPITYEPKLILQTTNFKTNYSFKEVLIIENITGVYFDTNGVQTNLNATDLNLISGTTSVLGTSFLVFGYGGVTQTVEISVTNIGANQGGGTVENTTLVLNAASFSPNLTESPANYTDLELGGMSFSGGNVRKRSYGGTDIFMIESGGYFYNKTSLGPIETISLTYASGGSADALQAFTFSDSPLSTKPTTVEQTITKSAPGTTTIVNAGHKEYFRFDVSNKNLQALITITYQSGTVLLFTAQEQVAAYATYFLETTHAECLVSNVKTTTWDKLGQEFNAMSEEAKALLKTSAYSGLQARYQLIINTYGYDDYMSIQPSSGLPTSNNQHLSYQIVSVGIVLISLLMIGIYIINRDKKHI